MSPFLAFLLGIVVGIILVTVFALLMAAGEKDTFLEDEGGW